VKHFWQWPCLSAAAALAQPVTLHFSVDVVWGARGDEETSAGKSTERMKTKLQLTNAGRAHFITC